MRSCSTAGDYTVGETAAGTTSLANYTSQIACTTNGAPSESGNGTSLAGVTVPDEGTVVCTITNTRKPNGNNRPELHEGRRRSGIPVAAESQVPSRHGPRRH